MMKHILSISILSVLSLLSCKNSVNENSKKKKQTPRVDVIVAEPTNFTTSIDVNGSVLSNEMIELHSETSGRLIYLNIPDGAHVEAGTVLARINDTELQAQLQQLRSQLTLAQKNEQRLSTLLQINGVNQADYDVAQNQVSAIQANIKVIQAQIEKTIIKAPFSGNLGLRMVSVGALVSPQTLIGTLQQIDNIKVDFSVPESYISLVNVGNTVTIQPLNAKEKMQATISAIEPQINTSTRNIKVRAIIHNKSLNPGSYVKVQCIKQENGIIVPSNAIIPDAFSNQLIVISHGKAQFKNVETGIRTASTIEIVKGIEIGDTIVISGVLNVRPKDAVIIKKVTKMSELQ